MYLWSIPTFSALFVYCSLWILICLITAIVGHRSMQQYHNFAVVLLGKEYISGMLQCDDRLKITRLESATVTLNLGLLAFLNLLTHPESMGTSLWFSFTLLLLLGAVLFSVVSICIYAEYSCTMPWKYILPSLLLKNSYETLWEKLTRYQTGTLASRISMVGLGISLFAAVLSCHNISTQSISLEKNISHESDPQQPTPPGLKRSSAFSPSEKGLVEHRRHSASDMEPFGSPHLGMVDVVGDPGFVASGGNELIDKQSNANPGVLSQRESSDSARPIGESLSMASRGVSRGTTRSFSAVTQFVSDVVCPVASENVVAAASPLSRVPRQTQQYATREGSLMISDYRTSRTFRGAPMQNLDRRRPTSCPASGCCRSTKNGRVDHYSKTDSTRRQYTIR